MGRKLRRVALDFSWPLNEAWKGYRDDFEPRECPSEECHHGANLLSGWIDCIAHLLCLLDDDRPNRTRDPHPWLKEIPFAPDKLPPREMAEKFIIKLGARPNNFFGHDAIDRWKVAKSILKAGGMTEITCPICKGDAIHPEDQSRVNSWKPTDPPKGEGYQMWETVSEGSPISPVFKTPEELARYLSENESGITSNATFDQWMKMITGGGYAPSMIITPGVGVQNGVVGVAGMEEKKE